MGYVIAAFLAGFITGFGLCSIACSKRDQRRQYNLTDDQKREVLEQERERLTNMANR